MITTSDTANILYAACAALGVSEVYQAGNIPDADKAIATERITVTAKEQRPETHWTKNYIEVNLCVPDLKNGMADTIRLQELERQATQLWRYYTVGTYDGSPYRYRIDSIHGNFEDKPLKCHYVNVKILFETQNTL